MDSLKMIKNLDISNICHDYGECSLERIRELEKSQGITLPNTYVSFIIKHNGADLDNDTFRFENPYDPINNEASIVFFKVEEIKKIIDVFLDEREQVDSICNGKSEQSSFFYEKLIPFGDSGGSDCICFDYREHKQDNPPVVIWFFGECDNSKRIVVVAKSFSEFVSMLREPDDLYDEEREARRKACEENKRKHQIVT